MKTLRSISVESYPDGGSVTYGVLRTAAGPVTVAADGRHLRWIRCGWEGRPSPRPTPLLRETIEQFARYFAGRRPTFDLPFRIDASPFTRRVLAEVEAIPYGHTHSYGEVAMAIGKPGAARAVGGAVGRNPLPVLIPCHRVLASDGRLGGFGCGLDWKRFLLRLEGIDWR